MNSEVRKYLSAIPAERKERIESIRTAFLDSVEDVVETMKYKMPTYEKDPNWAAIGNQKHYISVYFCSEEIIGNIIKKHPGINTGKGCVRIKDRQDIPLSELVVSFKKAMIYKKLTSVNR